MSPRQFRKDPLERGGVSLSHPAIRNSQIHRPVCAVEVSVNESRFGELRSGEGRSGEVREVERRAAEFRPAK
jgi:hypothetical protein